MRAAQDRSAAAAAAGGCDVAFALAYALADHASLLLYSIASVLLNKLNFSPRGAAMLQ